MPIVLDAECDWQKISDENMSNTAPSKNHCGQLDFFEVFLAIADVGTGYLSSPQYRVKIRETDDDGGNEVTETLTMVDFLAKAIAKNFVGVGSSKEDVIEGMKRAGFNEEKLFPDEDRYITVLSSRGGKRKTRRRQRM